MGHAKRQHQHLIGWSAWDISSRFVALHSYVDARAITTAFAKPFVRASSIPRILICVIMCLSSSSGSEAAGPRIFLCPTLGVNVWQSDLGARRFGTSLELGVRFDAEDWWSFGVSIGYEELRADEAKDFEISDPYRKVHCMPFDVQAYFNLVPIGHTEIYLRCGFGMMAYDLRTGSELVCQGTSVSIPLAFGLRFDKTSFFIEFGVRALGDHVDRVASGGMDIAPFARLGYCHGIALFE
jgi:hypothetical protein